MVSANSFVIFDVLFIATNLQKYNCDFNFSEINLFCYFSCLLSLYAGKPSSEWGYAFIKNEYGVPISAEVNSSIKWFKDAEYLIEDNEGYFNITNKGIEFKNQLMEMNRYSERKLFIENACDSLLLNSIGDIRSIIHEEPIIKKKKNSSLRQLLNDNSGTIDLLYNQFAILKHLLNGDNTNDMFLAALTWLKCVQNIEGFGYAHE